MFAETKSIYTKGKTVKDLIKALQILDENKPLNNFHIEHTRELNGHFGGEVNTQIDNYTFSFEITEEKTFKHPKEEQK